MRVPVDLPAPASEAGWPLLLRKEETPRKTLELPVESIRPNWPELALLVLLVEAYQDAGCADL